MDDSEESSVDEAMDDDSAFEDSTGMRETRQESLPKSDTSPEGFSPSIYGSPKEGQLAQAACFQGGSYHIDLTDSAPVTTDVEEAERMPVADEMVHSHYYYTSTTSTSPAADQFYSLDINQMILDPSTYPVQTSYISLLETSIAPQSSTDPFEAPEPTQLSLVPRPPRSNRHTLVQYYLTYHCETINEYHYYSYYDYGRLFTKGLFAMAEKSEALQLGMAAMAALIFSQRLDAGVKPVSFALYSLALKELQLMLNQPFLDDLETQIAIASAMQLSTFDVLPSLAFSHFSLLPFTCLAYPSFVPLLTKAFRGRQFEMFSPHGRRRHNHAPIFLPHKTNFHTPKSVPVRMVLRLRRPFLYSRGL